jgi:hypothetical protein
MIFIWIVFADLMWCTNIVMTRTGVTESASEIIEIVANCAP